LIEQGRFIGELTEHVLRLAGLGPGMRVLDVGCGAGDVTFLAARLVGAEGFVIGVDRSAEAIAVARERARGARLCRLLANLRPGGVAAFHEVNLASVTSEPRCALFQAAIDRIADAFTRAGFDPRTGIRLRRIFREAGLPAPQMHLEGRVESGPDSPLYALTEQMTRSLLPVMERTGVATAGEVGVDTLAVRLRDEAVARDAVLVFAGIGAWACKDAA
jgi:Methyltransferase domain